MTDFARVDPPNLIQRFLQLCPEFKTKWAEHLASWGDDERGDFNNIEVFAHFLVESYDQRKIETFPTAFAEIERLLTDGNAKIKELISIGLLEDLQTIASNRDFGPQVFLPWLGPASRQAWYGIAKAWKDKQSLMDVVRDEQRKKKDT